MNQMAAIHPYWLIGISLGLSIFPLIVGLCTSYLKVSVVLGLLRSGIGAQQVPSTMLVMALSIALSMFIMAPVCSRTWEIAEKMDLEPLQKLPLLQSVTRYAVLIEPWREFMAAHAGARELEVLRALDNPAAVSATDSEEKQNALRQEARQNLKLLVPAFVLSEIKQAFAMGFVLLLPFLVIDLIVANVLAGMGMMMVSPAMISLPLKLVLFVVADGWLLLSRSLIMSYGG